MWVTLGSGYHHVGNACQPVTREQAFFRTKNLLRSDVCSSVKGGCGRFSLTRVFHFCSNRSVYLEDLNSYCPTTKGGKRRKLEIRQARLLPRVINVGGKRELPAPSGAVSGNNMSPFRKTTSAGGDDIHATALKIQTTYKLLRCNKKERYIRNEKKKTTTRPYF